MFYTIVSISILAVIVLSIHFLELWARISDEKIRIEGSKRLAEYNRRNRSHVCDCDSCKQFLKPKSFNEFKDGF